MALLLSLSGCGEDSGITVRFEEAPSAAQPAKQPAPVTATAMPPAPPPPLVAQPPVKPVAPVHPVAATPTPTAPGRVGHAVAVFFDGPFFPSVDLSLTPTATLTGAVAVHDKASKDGLGAEGKLASLMPGEIGRAHV